MSIEIKYLDELVIVLKKYNILKDDICIVGSSTLAYHKIRENKDIDFIIKKNKRDKLFNKNTKKILEHIELVGFGWLANKKINDDEIITNDKYHVIHNGFKVVRLELVLARKKHTFHPKDQIDINNINKYIVESDYKFDNNLHEQSLVKRNILNNVKSKIKNRLKRYLKVIRKYQWTYCANSDLIIMQNTDKFLAYQYKDGKFNRYDTMVRYLAVENHLEKNNFGFELYQKMQTKRGFVEGAEEKFKNLIDSVSQNGFDECSALPVGNNQELADGSHRLALALYFNEKLIPLKLNRFAYDTFYGIDWFKKNDFTSDEIKTIEETKNKIFYEKGIYFQVVLWSPVKEYFDEIEKSLSNKYNILDSYTLDIKDDFENFVFDVYSSDDIDDWKIEKKLSGFKNYGNTIRVIDIEIINPRFRRKEANNHDISQEVEGIKKEYRTKYADKIENYFYDIIMHIGDNYHHTREIAKVLKECRL